VDFLPLKFQACARAAMMSSQMVACWLVFQRANKNSEDGDTKFSTASQLFDHYNTNVLIPFIQEIRKTLG
jgi:hypothetical protein